MHLCASNRNDQSASHILTHCLEVVEQLAESESMPYVGVPFRAMQQGNMERKLIHRYSECRALMSSRRIGSSIAGERNIRHLATGFRASPITNLQHPRRSYLPPVNGDVNVCHCNTVLYSLTEVCSLCQGGSIIRSVHVPVFRLASLLMFDFP